MVPYERTNQFLLQSINESRSIGITKREKIRKNLLFGKKTKKISPRVILPNTFQFFQYFPQEENLNLVWDQYPFVFIIEKDSSGNYIGLNFHFAPKKVRMEIFLRLENFLKKDSKISNVLTYEKIKKLIPHHRIITRKYNPNRFIGGSVQISYEYVKFMIMMDFYKFSISGLTDEITYRMSLEKIKKRKNK